MFRFLQTHRSRFALSRQRDVDENAVDAILKNSLARLHDVDSETHHQWLRLQRSLAQNQGEVRKTSRRLIPRLALATAIVAVAMVGAYFYFVPSQLTIDTFATGKGEQQRLVLQDSSEVTLNYATELVVTTLQPGEPRRLSLKGEAFFRVRRNETPFIVSTRCADVRVVGTEFNLREREGTLEVAVTHGIVQVRVVKDGKDSTLTLRQNQMALCAQNSFPKRIDDMPSPEYPGWLQGKLFLNRTPFAAACREIEMRFDVEIRIDDPNLRNEMITGTLNARTAESALSALCGLTGKGFKHDNQRYTIY